MVASGRGLAAGLLLGAALDAVLADPRRGHPVAAFGTAASRAETALWADSRGRGITMVAVCLAPVAAAGLAGQLIAGRPSARVAVTALATWVVLGGTSLAREAQAIGAAPWTMVTWPPRAAGCPRCAGATRTGSTRPGCPARWWNRSPRTPPTRWSPRCCGAPSSACPACSATARSTPSTR